MGLSNILANALNGAKAIFGNAEPPVESDIDYSSRAGRHHWRHDRKVCTGSGTNLTRVNQKTGTGFCPICEATGLKATKTGKSWVHLNLGIRHTQRGLYGRRTVKDIQHMEIERYAKTL